MKVLLTGSTGLIGSEVGRRLTARGDQVVTLVRDVARAQQLEPFSSVRYRWSHGEEVPDEALLGVDAIVHLAGEPIADGRWTREKKRRILESRVLGTRSLVRAIERSQTPPSCFILGSALGFYGNRGDEALDGESIRGAGFLADVVNEWEGALGPLPSVMRVVKIRTGIVLSARGGALGKMIPPFQLGLGGRLGLSGQQWMSWIHLDDLASMILYALDQSKVSGVLEGCSPSPVRNRDFVSSLAKALGKRVFLPVPAMVLRVALGEMASVLTESIRVFPRRALASGFRFEHVELGRALDHCLSSYRKG